MKPRTTFAVWIEGEGFTYQVGNTFIVVTPKSKKSALKPWIITRTDDDPHRETDKSIREKKGVPCEQQSIA